MWYKKNYTWVHQLSREIAQFKLGEQSLGDYQYHAKFQGMWRGLIVCTYISCCAKEQKKEIKGRRIFKLLKGLNPVYEVVQAQILSQDPLP